LIQTWRRWCSQPRSTPGCDANMETADQHGKTPLMLACCAGHVDVVRLLIDENGADMETADRYGRTALMHACLLGHVDVIKLLLRRGAAITEKIEARQAKETGFSAEVCTLLEQWKGLTDRWREIVQDHGWDYINLPGVWILENEDDESEFPVAFRRRLGWIALVLRPRLQGCWEDIVPKVFAAINAQV